MKKGIFIVFCVLVLGFALWDVVCRGQRASYVHDQHIIILHNKKIWLDEKNLPDVLKKFPAKQDQVDIYEKMAFLFPLYDSFDKNSTKQGYLKQIYYLNKLLTLKNKYFKKNSVDNSYLYFDIASASANCRNNDKFIEYNKKLLSYINSQPKNKKNLSFLCIALYFLGNDYNNSGNYKTALVYCQRAKLLRMHLHKQPFPSLAEIDGLIKKLEKEMRGLG